MEPKSKSRLIMALGWIIAAALILVYLGSKFEFSMRKRASQPGIEPASRPEARSTQAPSPAPQPPPELTTERLFQLASPSVVLIEVFDREGHKKGLGSGFVVSSDGSVVTNYHVIRGASRGIARFQDGRSARIAGVCGYDADRDVAVVKLAGIQTVPLRLANSDEVHVGQKVLAIGSPSGLQNTISEGIVSGIREGVIQMTTPISPGSSGGPVLDAQGAVVGVAVATVREAQNLNFSVPINWAKQFTAASPVASFDEVAAENEVVEYLVNGTISVPAGQARSWKISVNPNRMSNARLEGSFRSTGGVSGNIRVLVVRDQEVLYNSERTTSGEIELPLSDGEYQFIVDNRGSLMFPRSVTAQIAVRYTK